MAVQSVPKIQPNLYPCYYTQRMIRSWIPKFRLPRFSSTSSPIPGIHRRYEQFEKEFPEHLVLMQVGEFYEIYGEAVEGAAKILDIAVTRTNGKAANSESAVPMTGFPVRSFDTFLGKLMRAGVSVVVADQFIIPDSNRFDRRVTRIVTPGTLLEESLLDRNRNNFIAFLDASKRACAWMDISTGDFFVTTAAGDAELSSLLDRLKPRELLTQNSLDKFPTILALLKRSGALIRIVKDELKESPKIDSQFSKTESQVANRLLNYVLSALRGSLDSVALKPLRHFAPSQNFLSIDADSFRSLDILNQDTPATLFNTLNECQTALGSRLLARRLQAPFLHPADIRAAHDRVHKFTEMGVEPLRVLQKKLSEVGDIERILQRLCLRRPQGVARDLKSLARSLLSASEAFKLCDPAAVLLSPALEEHLMVIPTALNEKLPLRDADGELFSPGYSTSLDELRQLRDNSSAVFDQLAAEYRQSTGIANLRIVTFKGDQKVVDVPKATTLPDRFRLLMQTETKSRYTTDDLLTKSFLLRSISDRVIEEELSILISQLVDPVISRFADEIRRTADEIAQLDLDSSFALLALRQSYTRPEILDGESAVLDIVDGRHPVLDKMFSSLEDDNECIRHFTPNSLNLTSPSKFLLLTGPNMGGKSTFLRQNALILLMAQCGSFVPAFRCSFTPLDAIFTRIGASDDLARDKSTFMLEMSETAHILSNATARSLVLIDEIGRGTSASEGVALAAAIAKHLIKQNRAWVLFATHYHEIVGSPLLADSQLQMAKTEAEILEDGSVKLIPKVIPGIARHSYALPVASLAGIPPQVIQDAHTVLYHHINNKH